MTRPPTSSPNTDPVVREFDNEQVFLFTQATLTNHPNTIPTKIKRGNKESTIPAADPSSETLTYDAARALIRRLMTQFNIDQTLLEDSAGPPDSLPLWNPVF